MYNDLEYLTLLKHTFPSDLELKQEIIKLEAILSLPRGTEHFMSDLHGEFLAFNHLINNCSGVIREKIGVCLNDLTTSEQDDLATLIYYPELKLKQIKTKTTDFYAKTLINLIKLTSLISSKYSRTYVKKFIDKEYFYIIDELLHTKDNIETNIKEYFNNIINSIIENNVAENYIIEFSRIIKKLAVSRLHIAGDIFDRGRHPGSIIELLKKHHSFDIQWGNHDILWFGAHAGNIVMLFYAIYNTVKYNNLTVLENSYGISLRKLTNYANLLYADSKNVISPLVKTTLIMLLKIEGNLIKKYPQYFKDLTLVLNNINYEEGTYSYNGQTYELIDKNIKGLDYNDPYKLSVIEEDIISSLVKDFKNSPRLKDHISFLIDKGSVYLHYNDNLIYHGCVPVDENKNFKLVNTPQGLKFGKQLFDYLNELIKKIPNNNLDDEELAFLYYLWNGYDSPFTGRNYKTFELAFLNDKNLQNEKRNPYYEFRNQKEFCLKILKEFNVSNNGHIVNGHLPVKVKKGESPIKASGKLIIIDGGFCKAYHDKTGIAGYTLIANSHGLRIKAHEEFLGIEEVLANNKDIISNSQIIETYEKRQTIADTTEGSKLKILVEGLKKAA